MAEVDDGPGPFADASINSIASVDRPLLHVSAGLLLPDSRSDHEYASNFGQPRKCR